MRYTAAEKLEIIRLVEQSETDGLDGGARWIRTAGPARFGRKRPLPAGFSALCQRRSARLKRTGEGLASASDQSDVCVCVCPTEGAGRHETQSIRVGN